MDKASIRLTALASVFAFVAVFFWPQLTSASPESATITCDVQWHAVERYGRLGC